MNTKSTRGVAALISVLVLSGIAFLASITISMGAITESDRTFSEYAADRARASADACAEYALYRLQKNQNYVGDEAMLVGKDECYIHPVEANGSGRIVRTESSALERMQRIKVTVTMGTPEIVVSSWRPVANLNE